ncbi:MAG: macro domain-containing protein [Chloroflexi bacterium]|nr:macro domain-containing protein [Chloroflexota bacterium]MDA8188997.1 macro domain-containing protein [Dehalococcoidales bacterium]
MPAISLFQGDITELATDAIVNAANNHLWMGAGVAGAIKRAGGQEIEDEAVKKGPIPVGEAVVTHAGRLKAEYVIHAAVMGLDLTTDAHKIRAATVNSLRRAEELGLKSIAFPALGTGVGGFPLDEAAEIMIGAVRDHLSRPTSLEEVVFALRGHDAYHAFERKLGAIDDTRG